ncbi:hypothetical protein GGD38_007756 [Chitinophagaceae bacterium OAS944]|nr:hypothetical protein [Chitinophagaceae bacterium OAS944]
MSKNYSLSSQEELIAELIDDVMVANHQTIMSHLIKRTFDSIES